MKNRKTMLHSKQALYFIFLTVFIDAVGIGIIIPIMPELIMELTGEGISRAAIYGGWMFFIYAFMQFFCAPIVGNLSDRYGRRSVLLFSLVSLSIDYAIMACRAQSILVISRTFSCGNSRCYLCNSCGVYCRCQCS